MERENLGGGRYLIHLSAEEIQKLNQNLEESIRLGVRALELSSSRRESPASSPCEESPKLK